LATQARSEQTLSAAQARRIALAAQGFGRPRPTGAVDRRHVRRVFADVGLVQIDSVNVVVRSQELPLWARLGHHNRETVPAMTADAELFEYWGHEASLIPIALYPLFRWKMAREHRWKSIAELERSHPGYVRDVLDQVRERGPLRVNELSAPGEKRGPWWGWSRGKIALEHLFWTGTVSSMRLPTFERVYDLTERIIPPAVLAAPAPAEDDARRELLRLASRSLGVGTLADLCDYYRLNVPLTKPRLAELVEAGDVTPVRVEGWKEQAYLARGASVPRRISAASLLSPFDSLVWFRRRDERLFGFHYRIELYTPAPKRVYGYYVLPFLLGDEIVGRIDVKADRAARTLVVPGAFAEPGHPPEAIVDDLTHELVAFAAWLGLDRVAVGDRGELAKPLRRALAQMG
jgi:uncharacterized protein